MSSHPRLWSQDAGVQENLFEPAHSLLEGDDLIDNAVRIMRIHCRPLYSKLLSISSDVLHLIS